MILLPSAGDCVILERLIFQEAYIVDLFDQLMHSDQTTSPAAASDRADRPSVRMDPRQLLEGLNPQQRQAVEHDQGPLLILAGAGSGKTRVITHRIAWLITVRNVRPQAILAITFTNKAAAEMKHRIEELIGSVTRSMWVGTFHAMMMRILRRFADRLGFERNFAILDTDDQMKVVKACLKELKIDEKAFNARAVHSQISSAKNSLIDVEAFISQAGSDYRQSRVAQVYQAYQEKLRQSNSMDFDDILFEAVRLLRENDDILTEYQSRFQYILVDEYQDTNHAQYQLVHMLSAGHGNLCVVGDDDQSIYSFRGANIQNILDFEKDFKRCKVIKLEQNYRSTKTILGAANQVIRENTGRKEKALWTDHGHGEQITFLRAENHSEESRYIATEIQRLVKNGQHYGDMAILYRVNALSRNLEAALREQGVLYRIFGGTRFYDRREVKDVLAYLRLVLSPRDEIAFSRVINVPRRGLGDVTIAHVQDLAEREQVSSLEICEQADRYDVLQRMAPRLLGFAAQIQGMRDLLTRDDLTFAAFLDQVEQDSGLLQEIIDQQERSKDDAVDRIENMKELISDALEFEQNLRQLQSLPEAELQPEDEDLHQIDDLTGILRAYLERAALYADMDQDKENQDYVRLMTIHSAKGLEFQTVFLVGTEEGLFPGFRARDSEAEMEEERRLGYVAITRAKQKLYITTARSRLVFGQTMAMPVAHFIQGIDDQYIEEIGGSRRPDYQQAPHGAFQAFDSGTAGAARPAGSAPSRDAAGRHVFPGSAIRPHQTPVQPLPDIDPADYRPGVRVRHEKFGSGKIVSALPVAGDAILQIEFQSSGKKRMMARMAKLEILD